MHRRVVGRLSIANIWINLFDCATASRLNAFRFIPYLPVSVQSWKAGWRLVPLLQRSIVWSDGQMRRLRIVWLWKCHAINVGNRLVTRHQQLLLPREDLAKNKSPLLSSQNGSLDVSIIKVLLVEKLISFRRKFSVLRLRKKSRNLCLFVVSFVFSYQKTLEAMDWPW